MAADGFLYRGQVTATKLVLWPYKQIEFKIRGCDPTFVADHRYLGLRPGDRVCAVCRRPESGQCVVVEMVHRGPDEAPTDEDEAALLARVGASLEPQQQRGVVAESWPRRVLRSCRERVETEYIKALGQGVADPVILVDARGANEPKGSDDPAGGLPLIRLKILPTDRAQAAERIALLSRAAGESIAGEPDPKRPLTVAVITGTGVELSDHPDPRFL